MKKLTFLIFIAFIIPICFPNSSIGQNFEEQFDEILSEQSFENSPGYAVLIAKNDEVIYRKAFGYADLELNVKLQPEHIFRIGSITKQFTACAILKLEEEGKLLLQDNITKYIEDYPTHGYTITIEHLLTHTSGIKSFTGMKEWDSEFHKKDFKPEKLIDFFKKEPMDFAPGEKFSYNNSAYFILGYIIEIVSGKTYEEYLTETFFNPLGLKNTSYENPKIILKNRVSGYQMEENKLINSEFLSMTQPYAAGSLLSTVDDLKTWYYAVMNEKIISEKSLKKAHSSFRLNNGKITKYGYGWFVGELEGTQIIHHSGGINGFRSGSIYIPRKKAFIVVLSNQQNNPSIRITKDLAKILITNDSSK